LQFVRHVTTEYGRRTGHASGDGDRGALR
jgi:hypothetical protein